MKNEQNLQFFDEHKFNVEISEIKKLIPLVVELENICLDLANVKTIREAEIIYNEKTGFPNTLISFTAFNREKEYKRALDIESKLSDKLSKKDLTDKKELKKSFVDAVRLKHSNFFTDEQMKTKSIVEELMQKFNSLDKMTRQQVGFNRLFELAYYTHASLRNRS